MTVSSSTDRATFPGNGVATAFPMPFRFFDNSDVVAQAIVDATGQATPLTLGVDYLLTGAGQPEEAGSATGVLTTSAPVPIGVSLFAQRVTPVTQPTDIVNQGRFFPETHETVFDRLTMLIQQVGGDGKGAIRVAVGEPEPARLPNALSRALMLMGFDSLGDPIAVSPASGSSAELALLLSDFLDPGLGAGLVGRSIRHINSLVELRALVGRYDGEVVYLRGRSTASSLGAGNFRWVAGSVSVDNDGTLIGADPDGRWFRIGAERAVLGEWFGVGNDGADYTAELQNAIDYASAAGGGAQGMRVELDRGSIGLSDKITLPNRVAVHGANGRGTAILALDTFNPDATEMFHAVNGTSSMFGSRLVDLFIDMRGKGAATARCIYSQAWQETCGMERVCLIGFPKYGLEYSDGYGGAAYLPLKDIEIFGGASGTTPTAGIKINQVSSVGGFVLSVDGATITGATSAQCPAGISMTNDTLVARGLHFEYVDNGVVGSGIGGISIDTITGSSNNVGTLVALGSAWTGQLNIRDSITNGATNHVKNNDGGAVIPSGAGMQPEITYPDKAQSAALGYVIFDASATAVDAQCTIVSKSANIKGVLKTAVGKFTVQWLYTMPNKQRSVGGGITNLNNTDPIKVTHTGSTGSSEVVQVRRKTDDTTWNDYDPQRCSLQFFGDRL